MLSRPNFGWSTLQIGDFYDNVSYLTEVPLDCLEAMIRALKYHIPFIVEFDTEGNYILLISGVFFNSTVVTTYREKSEDGFNYIDEDYKLISKEYDIDKLTLAKELYYDIFNNIDDWSIWSPCCEPNTVEEKEYNVRLVSLLEELNGLIIKGED